MNRPNLIKVVLLGASGVGKSSLMFRYVTQGWEEGIQSTLGAAFMDKQVNYKKRTLKYQIWDTAGQEKYAPLAQMYYRDCQIAILVYDCTNRESFNNLKNWYIEICEKGPKDVIMVVVANKSDLKEEEIVSPEEGKKFAEERKAMFAKTSARENFGITELFDEVSDKVIKRFHIIEDEVDMKGSVKISSRRQSTKESGGCC
jgi:small GTP-binding protein